MSGTIIEIFIAEKHHAVPVSQPRVFVEANRGIKGDRHYADNQDGSPKTGRRNITFISAEEIDRFNTEHGTSLGYGAFRRNIITRGVELNALVERQFVVGTIRFLGVELCEPCGYLAKTVHAQVLPYLNGRAGLRATVLSSGELHVDDEFQTIPPPHPGGVSE